MSKDAEHNKNTQSAQDIDDTPSTPRKPKKTHVSEDLTPSSKDIKNFFQKTLGLPETPSTPIKTKKTVDAEDTTPSMEDIRTFFKNTSASNTQSALTTVHAVSAIQSAFNIIQSGIIDRENKVELRKLREAVESLEQGGTSDLIDI